MADPFAQFMLVCEHKTNGRKLISNGVSILEDLDIMTILSQYPDIRMTTKTITPGKTTFEIFKADLIVDKSAGQQHAVKGVVSDKEGHSFGEITVLFSTDSAASATKTEAKAAQGDGNDGAGPEQ